MEDDLNSGATMSEDDWRKCLLPRYLRQQDFLVEVKLWWRCLRLVVGRSARNTRMLA